MKEKKQKPKFNFKTKVWPKYAISFGALAIATSITLGSLYAYSKKSPDKLGRKNQTDPFYLQNKFVQTKDAKTYFVTSDKNRILAQVDLEKDTVKFKEEKLEKTMSVEQYIQHFYNINKRFPTLNIKYGSFDFFNEYLEAVTAKDFKTFTDWFMFNVSWGPEIVTLKEFSIVKGVEMKGNSITLGSHSDQNKEYMTIKFYPDAFFGTLAVYSELSGRGNSSDALLYKLNKKLLTSTEVNKLLQNTPGYNAAANMSVQTSNEFTFRNIVDIRTLIGSKVYALPNTKWTQQLEKHTLREYEKNRLLDKNFYSLIINGKDRKEAEENLKNKIKENSKYDKYEILKNVDVDTLQEKYISNVSFETNAANEINIIDRYLKITFTDGTSYNLYDAFTKIQIKDFITETSISLPNCFSLAQSLNYVKEVYSKESVRINQGIATIKEKIKGLNQEKETLELDYTSNKKELTESIAKTEQRINELKAITSPTPEQTQEITKLEAELKEFQNDLKALEDSYPKNKTKLEEKTKSFENNLKVFENFVNIKNEEYLQLQAEKLETNPDINKQEEFAIRMFDLAKGYQNKYIQVFNELKLPSTIEPQDVLKDTIVIYNQDLAFLSNQIITNESLKNTASNNYLNWRDFYNLNSFLNEKITSNSQDNEFYVYSPHFKSLVNDYNKAHPNAKVKMQYQELINQVKKLSQEKQVIVSKINEIDEETKSLKNEYTGKIFNSLYHAFYFYDKETSSYEEGDLFIKSFKMPGIASKYSPLYSTKEWEEFCKTNFENLHTYLNKVKTKWDEYYNKIKNFVTTHQALANEIVELEEKFRKAKEEHPNWPKDWKVYYTYIKPLIDQINSKKQQWNLLPNNPNHIIFEDVVKIKKFNEQLTESLALSEAHKSKEDQYYEQTIEAIKKDYEIRLVQFKLFYLLKMVNINDEKLASYYEQYVTEYTKALELEIKSKITEVQNKRKEFEHKKQSYILKQLEDEDKLSEVKPLVGLSEDKIQKSKELISKVQEKNTKNTEIENLKKEIFQAKKAKYDTDFNNIKTFAVDNHLSIMETYSDEIKKQLKSIKKQNVEIDSKIKEANNKLSSSISSDEKTFYEFQISKLNTLKEKNQKVSEEAQLLKKDLESACSSVDDILSEIDNIDDEIALGALENYLAKTKEIKEKFTKLKTSLEKTSTEIEQIKTEVDQKVSANSSNAQIKALYEKLATFVETNKTKIKTVKTKLEQENTKFLKPSNVKQNITKYETVQNDSNIKQKVEQKKTKENELQTILTEIQTAVEQGAVIVSNNSMFDKAKEYEKLVDEINKAKEAAELAAKELDTNYPSVIKFNENEGQGKFVELLTNIIDRNEELVIESPLYQQAYGLQSSLTSITGSIKNLRDEIKKLEEKHEVTSLESKYDAFVSKFVNRAKGIYEVEDSLANLQARKEVITKIVDKLKAKELTDENRVKFLNLYEDALKVIDEEIQRLDESLLSIIEQADKDLAGVAEISEYLQKAQALVNPQRAKLAQEMENIYQKFMVRVYANLTPDLRNDAKISKMVAELNEVIKTINNEETARNKKIAEFKQNQSKFSKFDPWRKYIQSVPGFNEALLAYKNMFEATFDNQFKLNETISYYDSYSLVSKLLLEKFKETIEETEKQIKTKEETLNTLNSGSAEHTALSAEISALKTKKVEYEKKLVDCQKNSTDFVTEAQKLLIIESEQNKTLRVKYKLDLEKAKSNFDDEIKNLESYFSNYSIFSEIVKFNFDTYSSKNEAIHNGLNKAIALSKEIVISKALMKDRETFLSSNQNYVEITKEEDLVIAKTKIELREKLLKLGIIKKDSSEESIDQLIKKVFVSSFAKDKRKLVFTMREKAFFGEEWAQFGKNATENYAKFAVDAKANRKVVSKVTDLLSVLGYKKVLVPRILREEGDIKDEQGNLQKGYAIYTDGYENLVDEVLEKVPYAAEWLEGPHLEQVINDETGEITYEVKNGKYLGFTKDSRVGLWAILKATNPEFKGIAIDFLKFVAAHEYGHHMTLNGAQNLGDKNPDNKSLFVSALTPGATPGITNYYNRESLDLYLKARTNLLLTTRTYLNGNYINADKNGEYPAFKYPVFNDQGEIIDYIEEKTSDIWGTEINDSNAIAAIKNKKRRFIQDFEGMKKALEERRKELNDKGNKVSLFDLWLTNTLDTFSGTLNPSVSGQAKYMVWDNSKKRYVFQEGSLKLLKGILKDGSGKEIDIKVKADGTLDVSKAIADFEYVAEDKTKGIKGKFIVKQIFINDNNKNPIISVPLNEDIYYKEGYGEQAVKYILEQIKDIQNNIETLIVKKFLINGWDNSATALTIDPKMSINFAKLGELNRTDKDYKPTIDWYKDYVNNRDFAKATMTADHLAKPTIYYENGEPYGQPLPDKFFKDNYFVNLSAKPTLYQELLELIILGGSNGSKLDTASGFETYVNSSESYVANVNLDLAFDNNILFEDLGSSLSKFNVQKILLPLNKIGFKLVGNNLQNNLWIAYGANDKIVGQFKNPQLKEFFDMKNTTKMYLNSSLLSKKTTESLFNSIYHTIGATKNYGDNIYFTSVKDWMKFNSIDLTRAKLNQSTKTVDWDLAYVKTKFNINAFRRGLKVALKQDNLIDLETKNALTNLVENGSDQDIANEIMKRYANSPLAAFTKSFKLLDIETNQNLAWIFDQKIGFGKYKTDKFNVFSPDENKFEFGLTQLIKTIKDFAATSGIKAANLTGVDYLVIDNKISLQTEQMLACILNKRASLINILLTVVNGNFKKIAPSTDALSYFNSKNERRFNEFFTDYTYNFAEVINRDNLQITYSPPKTNFGNMPSYLSGISEATTGLEYVVDALDTKKWLKALIKFKDEDNKDSRASVFAALLFANSLEDEEKQNIANSYGIKINAEPLADKEDFKDNFNFRNSYFGKLQTHNNGWFKDRWYREFLGFELYDNEGKDKVDDSIRITDLTGKKVNTRARAYWQYYIQSQGVGKRTLSGIWRDKDKDAIAFYGYIPKHLNKNNVIKYLAFKNTKTGEIKTIPLNIKNSNNMFYYTEQNLDNEENAKDPAKSKRHYLADEEYVWTDSKGNTTGINKGFDSYVSDYVIASKYSNALLKPGQEFELYFAADEKGTYVCEMFLGKTESVSENGKTYSQAPTTVTREKNGKTILRIQNQFNVY